MTCVTGVIDMDIGLHDAQHQQCEANKAVGMDDERERREEEEEDVDRVELWPC